jgi:hypothetical protein
VSTRAIIIIALTVTYEIASGLYLRWADRPVRIAFCAGRLAERMNQGALRQGDRLLDRFGRLTRRGMPRHLRAEK